MKNPIFGNKRIASLDIHSPLYIRTKSNPYGGGDISDLYKVIDHAAMTGFSVIQMTPLQDTGLNPCPYSGISIFSFNPVFLPVDSIPQSDKLSELKNLYLTSIDSDSEFVDYGKLYQFKIECLKTDFHGNKAVDRIKFDRYDNQTLAYALYVALKGIFKQSWDKWPLEFRKGNVQAILKENPELHHEVKFILYTQDLLKKEWQSLHRYALKKGVQLAIDKPIYPDFDSADVWANQNLFYLNPNGSIQYVSGCNSPGDPYGQQIWGHAVYRFQEKPEEVIRYFVEAIRHISKISKVIRLDHTLALIWKYYLIDPKTSQGHHLPALKEKLFNRLKKEFPDVYFIAEDLGYVSEGEVDKPLKQLGIPGMRCLQWFYTERYSTPAKYPFLSMGFGSNHDLPGMITWWQTLMPDQKGVYYDQLQIEPSENPADDLPKIVKLLLDSPAQIVSITLRDLVEDLRQFNIPGTDNQTNWVLRSPLSIENINFKPIAEAIKASHRH